MVRLNKRVKLAEKAERKVYAKMFGGGGGGGGGAKAKPPPRRPGAVAAVDATRPEPAAMECEAAAPAAVDVVPPADVKAADVKAHEWGPVPGS